MLSYFLMQLSGIKHFHPVTVLYAESSISELFEHREVSLCVCKTSLLQKH